MAAVQQFGQIIEWLEQRRRRWWYYLQNLQDPLDYLPEQNRRKNMEIASNGIYTINISAPKYYGKRDISVGDEFFL